MKFIVKIDGRMRAIFDEDQREFNNATDLCEFLNSLETLGRTMKLNISYVLLRFILHQDKD